MKGNIIGTRYVVSIIVSTFNSAWSLKRCLDTLLSQDLDVPYEIIVSDDGSSDNTPELMLRYMSDSRVKYFRHKNVRLAENRNIGARNADGEVLIFLDADMLTTENFIYAHYNAISKGSEKTIVSGSIPVADECKNYHVGRYLDRKWQRRLSALEKEPDDVFLMQGGNFSIRKDFFFEVGRFDASFIEYGAEDTDFFIRAKNAGADFIFNKEAQADHIVTIKFSVLCNRVPINMRAAERIVKQYPELKLPQKRRVKQRRTLTDHAWQACRRIPQSQVLLYRTLPFLERILPDKTVFVIYDSLLSALRYSSHSRR